MRLFGGSVARQIDAWLQTVTIEELEQMEKQGFDVQQWKSKVAARLADKAAKPVQKCFPNPVDLSKLDAFIPTPRDVNSDFVRAVAGKSLWFGNAKKRQKAARGALIYAAVVQANSDLWRPGGEPFLPAVLLFALDEAHKNNVPWLRETAAEIAALKMNDSVPPDCRQLIASLRNHHSNFCRKVGDSIRKGANAWCAVYTFESPPLLPRKCLPSDGIVPFILKDEPEEGLGVGLFDIPGYFYIA